MHVRARVQANFDMTTVLAHKTVVSSISASHIYGVVGRLASANGVSFVIELSQKFLYLEFPRDPLTRCVADGVDKTSISFADFALR